jgi:short-subunit dehydrogenase
MLKLLPFSQAIAAGAAASIISFFFMDANPALWILDRTIVTPKRLQNEFAGKRIWITGASSGIGAELAKQLTTSGAQVVISGRNEEKLKDISNQTGARAVVTDVDISEVEMTSVMEQVGHVDCVILNAGIGQLMPALRTKREDTEEMFRINTLAPIHWTRFLLTRPNPPTQFVITSSVAAKFGVPLSSSYAASKHAIMGYFSSLAAEHPNLKIALPCPGPVATSIFGTPINKAERKMDASRCARLILSSMILGGETWIAQQPTLFYCYLNQYFPIVSQFLLHNVLGPTRVALWEANLNIYDPSSIRELMRRKKDKDQKKK